jgi:hypothetical protein
MLIFLDTEFTNFSSPSLISIGLAADSGEEFYAELPFAVDTCSAFVRDTVIPMLGKYENAFCPIPDIGSRVACWLKIVRRGSESIEICVDDQIDWELFTSALGHYLPRWCDVRNIGYEVQEMLRYEFHEKYALPEHHALHDAQAARYAFRPRTK